ncbi:MAG TPA: FAD-binding oxidoreductase [Rubricoccaceae bacterium]|jgi:glycine/D-amino acid oxidase-like deaminating enzyme
MTVSPWQRPLETTVCDVAVVGGGIAGTSAAYALKTLAPHLRVVLLDAGRLAGGASGRNAGFLMLGTHADYASAVDAYGRDVARRVWAFTAENLELALSLPGSGAVRTGSLLGAGSEAEADRLFRSQGLLAEDGVEAAWTPGDGFGTRGFAGTLHVPDGGTVDPVLLVQTLARASGAEVREHTRVERLVPAGGGIRLDLAGGGAVEAGRVYIAANATLPALVPELAGVVRPLRAQMLASAPVAPFLPVPVYSHDGFYYARQTLEGHVLVGGARHLHEDTEVGHGDETTDALQADLDAYLRTHLPDAAGAPVVRRWAGTMGFSPDGLPVLGDVPGVPGAVYAAGFTGHGMGYGMRFGHLAARRLLGLPDAAESLFSAERLAS